MSPLLPLPVRPRPLAAVALAAAALLLAGCSTGGGSGSAAEGRVVETVLGDVEVPEQIDSVVVLEGRRDLDIVLSLGLPLVGFPYEGPDTTMQLEAPLAAATAAAQEDGARELFLADEINLEAIVEAAPSVIVSRVNDVEPIIDELTAIAPVIAVNSNDGGTWQDDLLTVAEATGTEDRAAEVIAEFDARVEEIAETYATQIAETRVLVVSYEAEGTLVQSARLPALLLERLGARFSQSFTDAFEAEDQQMEYGAEQTVVAHSDAEAILALADTAAEWDAAQADALWLQLPAVQAGTVVRGDKMVNEGAQITAMHLLDLLEELYQKA
jgi:iron complex transport system substrate-binding protein